jgi:hypothetical protein
MIERRPAAFGAIRTRHGALQMGPEGLKIDQPAEFFQGVALCRQRRQTLIDVEKSTLPHHLSPQAANLRKLNHNTGQMPRFLEVSSCLTQRSQYELHLDYPFAGSRMLQGLLAAEGHTAGRLHASTLMKRMGIEAIYRRPNTSKPEPGHKIFPYLLPKLPVTRLNHAAAPTSIQSDAANRGINILFNSLIRED